MRINSVHNAPVFTASVGHARVKIIGPDSGPVSMEGMTPAEGGRQRRSKTKAAVRKRRDEIAQGAGFLERLTLTRNRAGTGQRSAERNPARRRSQAAR